MYKNNRQSKILELIETNNIETQDELVSQLLAIGFKVTQATISRDIKTLGLIKISAANNRQKYARGESKNYFPSALSDMFGKSILTVIQIDKNALIRTAEGCGKLVKHAIRKLFDDESFFCIADDDTVMVACKDEQQIMQLVKRLHDFV